MLREIEVLGRAVLSCARIGFERRENAASPHLSLLVALDVVVQSPAPNPDVPAREASK